MLDDFQSRRRPRMLRRLEAEVELLVALFGTLLVVLLIELVTLRTPLLLLPDFVFRVVFLRQSGHLYTLNLVSPYFFVRLAKYSFLWSRQYHSEHK